MRWLYGLGLVSGYCYRTHTEIRHRQERKMKYHNGRLRNLQDATLCLRPEPQKQELSWKECIPFAILGALLLTLLLIELFR